MWTSSSHLYSWWIVGWIFLFMRNTIFLKKWVQSEFCLILSDKFKVNQDNKKDSRKLAEIYNCGMTQKDKTWHSEKKVTFIQKTRFNLPIWNLNVSIEELVKMWVISCFWNFFSNVEAIFFFQFLVIVVGQRPKIAEKLKN